MPNFITPTQVEIDTEISIIGACLFDAQNGYQRIHELITPEMFGIRQHQIIFEAIAKTAAPHDMIGVITTLSKSGKLQDAGGQAAITRMMEICVHAHDLERDAGLLTEAHQKREALRINQEIEKAIAEGNINRAAALGETLSDIGATGLEPGAPTLAEIDRLIDRGLSGSSLEAALATLAGRSRQSMRDLKAIYDERQLEHDRSEDRFHIRDEIRRLNEAKSSTLNLHEVLPSGLAKPLNQLARWMGLRPELYLFAILSATGSLQANGSQLEVWPEISWRTTPNLYTATVAESGVGKSPMYSAAITTPLAALQKEADEHYTAELEAWQANCKTIKQDDPDAVLPEEPQRRIFSFNRGTGESIPRQRQRRPEDGLLFIADELKAVFGSQNQYRSGRGSDAEDLLEYFDGRSPTILRADGVQCQSGLFNFSIAGGIQPDVLAKLMGDGQDSNGGWARFLFIHQPKTRKRLPDPGSGIVNLDDLLTGIYRRISLLPAMEYRLSQDAKPIFQQTFADYDDALNAETSQAMRAYLSKAAGKVAKIAMNLHIIEWATHGQGYPSEEISATTIQQAIAVTNMAIEQIRSLYAGVGTDDYTSLASHLAAVLELLERKGSLTPREIVSGIGRKFKANTATVKGWFKELDLMGLAKLEISGKRSWKLLPVSKNVSLTPIVAPTETNFATPKSYTQQDSQEFVANVAPFSNPAQTPISTPDLPSVAPLPPLPEDSPYLGSVQQVQQTPESHAPQAVEVLHPTATNTATIAETATVAPASIHANAGIKDKHGRVNAWKIEKVVGNCYHLSLPGTGDRKVIPVASIDPAHLLHE